jgi:Glyoxalase-like domain
MAQKGRVVRRRDLLAGLAIAPAALARRRGEGPQTRAARLAVDHLLLGARDLDEGVAWLHARTGVRAAFGGVHPGVGTRNALASLGGGRYLEIIAPDPAQEEFHFHIDLRALVHPRLVTWAVSSPDIDADAARARAAGFEVSGPRDGSRRRPDGVLLQWRTLNVSAPFADAEADPIPFFIEWAAGSAHPSVGAPEGCQLAALEFAHPDSDRLRDALGRLGLRALVRNAARAGLRATLDTPRSAVALE